MKTGRILAPLTVLIMACVIFVPTVVPARSEDASAPSAVEPNLTLGRPSTEIREPNILSSAPVELLLNFQDAPVRTVLDYLSQRTGLTIVSDSPLDGPITIVSRQPIGADRAIALINTVLREKDLVALRVGKTLKVLTLSKARTVGGLPVTSDRELDDVDGGDDVVTHILTVRYVDATALRQNLLSLIPESATIEANRDGNALIITDTTFNIKRMMKIVQALDSRMATVSEIKVFRLTRAQATSTAQLINNLFQVDQPSASRGGRQGGQGGRGGGGFDMMVMQGMRGGRGMGQDQQSQAGSDQPTTAANARVVAAADERSNAVVVRGPAEALKIVAGVIAGLDDSTAIMAGVRVFQLRYADALNVAQVVNQLFGQGRASGNAQQNPLTTFMRRGGGGGFQGFPTADAQQNASGPALQVTAAADSRTNTVVVTGPDTVLDVVEDTVKRLDAQIPNVADVKVFHLQYADATNTANLINQVFGTGLSSSTRSTQRNAGQNQQVMFMGRGGMGGMAAAGQGTTPGTTSDIPVVASADTRTNSVVVSGAPETLKVVADIVTQLDQNPEQERRIFVYPLKNAVAANLMTVMNDLFAQMRSLNQQGTSSRTGQQFQGGGTQRNTGAGTGAAAGQAAGATTETNANDLSDQTYFEADTTTNSLLVLTSSKNYDKVRPIIDDLDKPVGQVLIKVLFAEITHSDSVDLGTEFSMINLRSSGGSTTTSTIFGTPGAGLTLNVIEGDIDITLTALQKVGKLNVLSRPYVLTSNNQAATMSVAQEVPIPTGSTTVAGQTQTTVTYRSDIGIVLTVTPQVNPDGLVNMTIAPKITTIGADKVKISDTLDALTFATRSATTKVAVHDRQTIVIGGLIQDQVTDSIGKVPVLGSIPVLGVLFSRTVHAKDKTELLIFLTPLVAAEASQLPALTAPEQDGSELSNDLDAAEAFRRHVRAMKAKPDANQP